MISLLVGTIHSKEKNTVVILTSAGVGYEVTLVPLFAVEVAVGASVEVSTYMKMSDSAMSLYGFQTVEERAFFSLLLSVSGVGPKSAMNILSIGSVAEIEAAISRGDATYLSAVQGIGKKTAERMVVELKSKVNSSQFAGEEGQVGDMLSEVIDALVSMGYAKEEAKEVVRSLPTAGSTEVLLKEALQQLAR